MSVTMLALVLLVAPPPDGLSATLSPPAAQSGDLAARPLAAGRGGEVIAALEQASRTNPHDAAVLINLGIAYAQQGDDTKARAAFEAALACHEVVELDIADGTATDSRRLARRALKMLERGEFRPADERNQKLTLRN